VKYCDWHVSVSVCLVICHIFVHIACSLDRFFSGSIAILYFWHDVIFHTVGPTPSRIMSVPECIDSNKILLNSKNQQLLIVVCTVAHRGQSLLSTISSLSVDNRSSHLSCSFGHTRGFGYDNVVLLTSDIEDIRHLIYVVLAQYDFSEFFHFTDGYSKSLKGFLQVQIN